MRLLLLILLVSLSISACGQKGDLYIAPQEAQTNKDEPSQAQQADKAEQNRTTQEQTTNNN